MPSAFQERLRLAHALDSSVRVSRRVVGATVLRAPANRRALLVLDRQGRPRPTDLRPRPRRRPKSRALSTHSDKAPANMPALARASPLGERGVRLADGQRSNLPLRLALTSDGFAFSLTLFSESFSTVLRSTCSLSVSRSVSSLGWSVPPRFGLRSQATLLSNQGLRMQHAFTRAPSMGPTPALGTAPVVGSRTRFLCMPTISVSGPYATIPLPPLSVRPDSALGSRSTESSLSLHSPLLGESQLVSLPPLSNMLKFSG